MKFIDDCPRILPEILIRLYTNISRDTAAAFRGGAKVSGRVKYLDRSVGRSVGPTASFSHVVGGPNVFEFGALHILLLSVCDGNEGLFWSMLSASCKNHTSYFVGSLFQFVRISIRNN